MEQLHHLCFLVLLVFLVDQGQTQPLPQNTTHATAQGTTNVLFPEVNSSLSAPTDGMLLENNNSTQGMTGVPFSEGTSSTLKMDETSPSEETSTPLAPREGVPPKQTNSTWGYVILVFIILIIIALSLILFFIRRASRSYSFDLHRPNPMNNRNEPTGTFEPVYLDDFERLDLKDLITDDTSSLPVANGTSPKSEENGSSGEHAPQEQTEERSVESNSPSVSSQPLADSRDEKKASPPEQTNLFLEAAGEQENENNNNPSVCSSDPFVEVNLDGPAWCDQLLPPSLSSTVQPFSMLSASSSSSSSSIPSSS